MTGEMQGSGAESRELGSWDGHGPPLQEALATLSGLSAGAADDAELVVSAEAQTAVLVDAAVQCERPVVAAEELWRHRLAPELALFLRAATPLCEEALQQNEMVDVLADELAGLVDEDGGEGAAVAGRSSAAAGLVEHHSFSDLLHSKGRVLAAVDWHPSRRGVVATACTRPQQQQAAAPQQQHADGKAAGSGDAAAPASAAQQQQQQRAQAQASSSADFLRQPPTGCILVWNHADAIHPEAVLQAPADVLALAFHPTQPHFLAAGLATGQVALFNMQQQQQQQGAAGTAAGLPRPPTSAAAPAATGASAILGSSSAHNQQHGAQGAVGSTADPDHARQDGSKAAELLPSFVSMPEASHQAGVTDLQWLPGAVINRDGKLEPASGSEGATGAGSGASADTCTLFATTAADGSLLLWDMRITTRQRKAAVKGRQRRAPSCHTCMHQLCVVLLICPSGILVQPRMPSFAAAQEFPWLISHRCHPHDAALAPADEEQPDWKPVLGLSAASTAKQPLLATRFCQDKRWGARRFVLGSLEGELAMADATTLLYECKVGPGRQGDCIMGAARSGLRCRQCLCPSNVG